MAAACILIEDDMLAATTKKCRINNSQPASHGWCVLFSTMLPDVSKSMPLTIIVHLFEI